MSTCYCKIILTHSDTFPDLSYKVITIAGRGAKNPVDEFLREQCMIGTLGKRETVSRHLATSEEAERKRIDDMVERAQDDQSEAFAQIYEEFMDRVYRYVYARTGNVENTEDMTQEVFIRAFESICGYRKMGKPFLGWLIRIAHNLLVDHYRRENRGHFLPLPDDCPSGVENPLETAEKKFQMVEVRKAMLRLPPAQREALSLRFIAGLSISEAAVMMGKSQGAVKTLQHEAVAKLRKALENKGVSNE
jgi:RNA polymerase sigma-70 factor, ECF subfamily